MKKHQAYLLLHISVIFYGLTAILGKLITLSSIEIVWYRVGLASLSLVFLIPFGQKLEVIKSPRYQIRIALIGLFLALHWISFFESIQVSNVTVSLIGISSFPLFTAILEPFYFKERFQKIDIYLGLLILIGIYIIVSNDSFPSHFLWGLILATIAALLASIFTIMNREIIARYTSFSVGFYQLLIAFLLLSVWKYEFFLDVVNLSFSNFIYLFVLAVFCTAFAHLASIAVMKTINAFIVALSVNLEPVYGIILAFILFHENKELSTQFFVGASIILFSVFLKGFLSYKKKVD